jgi:hypothetical protein
MKYEYAVFTVRLKCDADRLGTGWDKWPHVELQDPIVARMNELGADGWEVFERSYPSCPPLPGETEWPVNLWARRRLPEVTA